MNGCFRDTWSYFNAEVWHPLADFSNKDAAAPLDLFSDLFAAVDEFISPRATDIELEEARNDPLKARQRFIALKGTDFTSESAIVQFLEEAYRVVVDYELKGFEELYQRLLRDALRKFNLRYRLEDPFYIRFLLPGSFTNLYSELHRLNASDSHLSDLWNDFELAFDYYVRGQSDAELRSSIARASNYLEGLASATNGKAGALGTLCNNLSDWPHDKVKEAVKNLYSFCSDYPGIRHAGNPNNRKRQLDRRDAVAVNVSLIAFAAYLSTKLDQGAMLGVGSGVARRPGASATGKPLVVGENGFIRRLMAKIGL